MEEQWLRMGKAAKVLHGREHCVPAAESTHTQLLQVPHGQDRRKSLRTKEDQPHQSLRIQVHQRAAKWIRTARHYQLNIYTDNKSFQNPFAFTDG